jgi:hypothetical protein
MTTKIFEEYLTQLGRKLGANNRKILLIIDQHAAHPKNTKFFSNIEVVFLPANCTGQLQPLDLGVIHAFKCHYTEQFIQKTVAMLDEGLLQEATQIKLDVLSAVHFIAQAWRLITPTTIKNWFLNSSCQHQ